MASDAALTWGGDISATPTGDIVLSADTELGQERILRRLLTNAKDYVWHPAYGAGLGQFVGTTTNGRQIAGLIKSQMFAETTVAMQPPPIVAAEALSGGSIYVTLNYVDAQNGGTQALTFTVNN